MRDEDNLFFAHESLSQQKPPPPPTQHQEFFSAFFSLSERNWTGFLSSRLGFSELIAFGLSLFAKSSNAARADLLVKGLPGLAVMLAQLATMRAVRSEKR